MRCAPLFVVVLLCTAAAACSSTAGSGGTVASASSNGAAGSGSSSGSDSGSDSGSGSGSGTAGSLDCGSVKTAAAGFGLEVQFLAQLRTPAQYKLVRDRTVTFDAAQAQKHIATLRALEDVPIKNPIGGSVKDALDVYAQAADLAQQNLAVDDPFTQAKGQELADLTKDTAKFLGHQVAIGLALDAAHC